ncbi:MAG: hypothetical protein JF612_13965 [Planctomycetia bacterium]|nr:hypothetical protein [Planctomycetia bacterium]
MANDLGLASALADEAPDALSFGSLEPLVCTMQETPINRLLPKLTEELHAGTDLRRLTAAAALANARSFGGEDYVGFHTMMALAPALHMAQELPVDLQPLPVFKVLYRNTNRIQEHGGRKAEVLHAVKPDGTAEASGEKIREAVRRKEVNAAEQMLLSLAQQSPDEAFNAVLFAVDDMTEVHRVVLPYRAWDLLGLIGKEQAHTLLRQSVRYCVKAESWPGDAKYNLPRTLLPKLLEEHKAMSLAANQLVLRDMGRTPAAEVVGKPIGSVHGDSIGVHACDSANAWRNMSLVTNPRNCFASLILGSYQVALDRMNRGGDFLHWEPLPLAGQLKQMEAKTAEALLREAEEAIRGNLQAKACAVVQHYGDLGFPARPIFDLMLRYAVSEDGALHAEKFYRTSSEEFASAREAFRWRYLVALARVTASEFGRPAAGMLEARSLLKV